MENPEPDALLQTREDNIVTITLNRPHKLNAMTKSMWGDLGTKCR